LRAIAVATMMSENSSGVSPSRETTRSPGRSPVSVMPSDLALRATVVAAGDPGSTAPITAGSVLRPTMNTMTRSTAATMKFATTPAEITIIRFHGGVDW
jgi:hypothetical protein